MSRTLNSDRQKALVRLIAEKRRRAGLAQADVARKLKQHQSFVAGVESGQRRIDVVEFLEIAEAIGFDAAAAVRKLQRIRSNR
jgi:transcriptional regulator with XRE-family HTH domain